jgi:hypothetical protein
MEVTTRVEVVVILGSGLPKDVKSVQDKIQKMTKEQQTRSFRLFKRNVPFLHMLRLIYGPNGPKIVSRESNNEITSGAWTQSKQQV